jgi:hypothetical protein
MAIFRVFDTPNTPKNAIFRKTILWSSAFSFSEIAKKRVLKSVKKQKMCDTNHPGIPKSDTLFGSAFDFEQCYSRHKI